jgi:acetate kinase
MIVLTVNSGSSSLKFGLYRAGAGDLRPLITGEIADGALQAQDGGGKPLPGMPVPAAIGHRIVHGGPALRDHCLIDDDVWRDLEGASSLSPLHGPIALSLIRQAQEAWPGVPQVACLDTAFHAGMPDIARTLPVAQALRREGVQRYGFHGLSCESIMHQLLGEPLDRIVIAHLGSGASVTAVLDRRSVDTSMGLTPSGGVMMSTRSGDLDPGILIYLLREQAVDPAGLEDLIDHRSGLAGVSGLNGDMRVLHDAAASNPAAKLAIDMFCRSVAKQIAGMIVSLDGVDALIFTGGIGEHDAAVRASVCRQLGWIGIRLDEQRNRSSSNRIDDPASRCRVQVLPSREDEQIARHASAIVASSSSGGATA